MRRHWRALTFLLLLCGAIYLLLATSLGLQLAWQVARTYVPGDLQVRELEGRWLGPLRVAGFHYARDGQRHAVEELSLDWRPMALLRGTLDIAELRVRGVALELGPGDEASEAEAGSISPGLKLPLDVRIDSLDIREVSVERLGEPLLQLDHIHLEARAEEDTLRLGVLELVLPQGRLEVSGDIGLGADTPTDLDLRWSAQIATLEPLQGKARLTGDWRHLRLDYQVLEPAPANLQLQVREPFGALSWSLALQLPEVALQRFSRDAPTLRLAADLQAEGDLHQADLHAELATDAGAGDLYPLRLRARGRDTGDGWVLEEARLEQVDGGGVLEAQGQGVYGDFSELHLAWQELRWPPLPASPLALSPRGELDWSGTPASWRYRLAGLLRVEDQGELDLHLEGDGDQEGMRLAELRLDLLDGTVRGQGALRWQPEPSWELTLAGEGINPGAWYPDWPGRLAATLHATGSLRGEQLHNRLQLQDLEGELRGQALSGQGLFIQQGEQLAVEGLELRSGEARLAVQGALGDQWRADWTLDIPDLAELLPGGQGRLTGSGQVEGPRQQPRLQARLEGDGLAWERQAVGSLALDLDWDVQGRWDLQLEAMELRFGDETLASLTAGVQGSPADHRLELAARRSDAALDLVLAGRWREAEWQGRILQADWQQEALGAWSLRQPAGLRASVAGGRLESLCWQRETAALCVAGEGDREQGWTTDLGLERLPLAWLEFLMPPGRQVQGQLDAQLQARLSPDSMPVEGRVQATLSPGQLRLGQAEDQVLEFGGGRLQGQLTDDRAELGLELSLAGNDRLQGDWVITGIGTQAAQLSGGLRGELRELALVEAFTGEVEGVRGHLMIDLRTQGPLSQPEIAGRLSLEQGQVAVPAAGIRLEDLRLALVAEDAAHIRIEGGARSGPEGEVRIEGLLRDAQTSDWHLQLGIQGERFLVVDIPEYLVRLTPDLQLEVVPRRVDLTGEVLVPQARLQPRDFSGAVGPSRDVVLVGNDVESEPTSPWAVHANLLLRFGEDVQVNAFGLRGFIDGGLRLIEEPGQPTRGRGALAIRDGRYRAYGQDLRIETGRLLYTDSPLDNPGLDIRAARHVNEIVAGIRVGGELRDPVLSLYSEPAMSESDTLSYLLFGRPMQQASDAEGATMMQAASALGLGGGGLLAAQIGETFGFDEVEIGGSGAGFEEAALLVGKYLSPRLYVQYSVGLLEPISTFRVRYQMSRRWTLQTETGAESGADLLFTLD